MWRGLRGPHSLGPKCFFFLCSLTITQYYATLENSLVPALIKSVCHVHHPQVLNSRAPSIPKCGPDQRGPHSPRAQNRGPCPPFSPTPPLCFFNVSGCCRCESFQDRTGGGVTGEQRQAGPGLHREQYPSSSAAPLGGMLPEGDPPSRWGDQHPMARHLTRRWEPGFHQRALTGATAIVVPHARRPTWRPHGRASG